jgi:superfamily I DNA/RNA helicase/mRNA-degrading endonuclease RelE of RelBE toxin-antitoxin system
MDSKANYTFAMAEKFPVELGRMPKKVQNAYQRTVIPVLQSFPEKSDPPRIKPLTGYKALWRIRVTDSYRLIYRVDKPERVVTMLMIDNRSKIYDRLGANDDGTPGVRIVANAEELLEKKPSREEVGDAIVAQGLEPIEQIELITERELPELLTAKKMKAWGVPENFHSALEKACTEGDLLEMGLPDDVVERVLEGLWPRTIEEIVQQPVRVANEPEEIQSAADGERSLESFLLNLDEEQKTFVSRFEGTRPKGPWLLKGGPGSGKSTVALYCIKTLIRNLDSELKLDDKPIRILLTTFTNALINASDHLLTSIGIDRSQRQVDIINVDKLAYRHLPDHWKRMNITAPRYFVKKAISACDEADSKFNFTEDDAEFLEDEIEWVIVGQGLSKVEDYLEADRSGRGRQLGQQQRRQIWELFGIFKKLMREQDRCTFTESLLEASKRATAEYDYVFIDEAQDLKPVAVRFCINLCESPSNVFLTADTNQSIYGSGMSWSRIATDLRVQGRARILRRNYRTTTEIWDAVARLAPDGEGVDRETLDVETVFRGPFPTLVRYSETESIGDRLNSYLYDALRQERCAPSGAAVLCPTDTEMDQVVRLLNPRLKAKKMHSKDVNLKHPGVKVMTMHAAKGLQFPVVAVVGVVDGLIPRPIPVGINPEEYLSRQKRLLFVACSRAMRRLMVFASQSSPSAFLSDASDDHWDIEYL